MKVLVIADDFTGANDTGAMLSQLGLSVISSPVWPLKKNIQLVSEVFCINTDSRSMDSIMARKTVYEITQSYFKGYPDVLLSKRIDTTLRGNIGAEIDGVLDALPDGYRAVVVPSCPRAGRICIGGYVLVHGVLLAKSYVAKDPRTPVMESDVEVIIHRQSNRAVGKISADVVRKGKTEISRCLKKMREPVVVIDAVDESDIREIAYGCEEAGLPIICVDPGDFTKAYIEVKKFREKNHKWKNLLLIGSLAPDSKEQVVELKERGRTCIYYVDVENLLECPQGEAERGLRLFAKARESCKNFCITTAESKRLEQQDGEALAEAIAAGLAWLAREVIRSLGIVFNAVYLSGGDVAKAFVTDVDVEVLEIVDELMPLAVWGRICGGNLDGMAVLTKGGMIGGRDAVHSMLEEVERRSVV